MSNFSEFRTTTGSDDECMEDDDLGYSQIDESAQSQPVPQERPPGPPKKPKFTMWNDFMLEQQLATAKPLATNVLERGSETFELPAEKLPWTDSIRREIHNKRKPPKKEHTHQHTKNRQIEKKKNKIVKKIEVKIYQEMKISLGNTRTSKVNAAQLSRNIIKRSHKKAFVDSEYSLESLMSVEFEDDLSLEQLGEEIAQALGEKQPATICRIVKELGAEKAKILFERTRQTEAMGGLQTADGKRKRAPGGVFIQLFKTDENISEETKKAAFAETLREQRELRRARRKGKPHVTPK